MDQAGWVVLVKVLEHPLQGLAGANLVAGGPHQHAGIVLIALQHADRALLTGDHIAGDVAGYAGVQPAAVVGFVVRLVHDIDAVLVAQLIEIRVVRIVRGAHRIQIVLLEQLDVRLHLLVGEVAARLRRHLAAVYALKVDRLAVQNHLRIGGAAVDYIKLAETDVDRRAFHRLAAALEGDGHAVQVRMLGVPLERVFKMAGQVHNRLVFRKGGRFRRHRLAHGVALRVVELRLHGDARGVRIAKAAQFHLGVQVCVHIFAVQIGHDGEVADLDVVLGEQVHIAVDTGQSQAVLVLNPAAVAPAEDLDGHNVLRALGKIERIGDVKLLPGGHILAVADLLAVDIEVHRVFNALKGDEDLAALPCRNVRQNLPVGADRVEVGRRCAGGDIRVLRIVFPGIILVGIDGLVVFEAAILVLDRLPAQRDRDVVPAAVVIAGVCKRAILLADAVGGLLRPAELPIVAVEQLVIGRLRRVVLLRLFFRLIRIRRRAGRFPVYLDNLGLPVPFAAVVGQHGER